MSRAFALRPLRAQILAHLDFAYGNEMQGAEKQRIAKRVAYNLGLVVAEVLAAARNKLPSDYIDASEGLERLQNALQENGFVAVSGHIANWEVCGKLMFAVYPQRCESVIAKRLGNPGLNDLIAEIRLKLGMRTVYQDESPLRLIRALRRGKIVGTVPDQDIARLAGAFIDFFGHPAYTPTGPATLAVHGHAPLLVSFTQRTAKGLKLVVCDPIVPRADADPDEEVLRITKLWSKYLEDAIRAHPSDWMWFHKRWETTPEILAARKAKRIRAPDRSNPVAG